MKLCFYLDCRHIPAVTKVSMGKEGPILPSVHAAVLYPIIAVVGSFRISTIDNKSNRYKRQF